MKAHRVQKTLLWMLEGGWRVGEEGRVEGVELADEPWGFQSEQPKSAWVETRRLFSAGWLEDGLNWKKVQSEELSESGGRCHQRHDEQELRDEGEWSVLVSSGRSIPLCLP